jgi:hypothetical protein
MTTDVIDTQLHLTAFPAQYIGPGTLIGNPALLDPVSQINGYFTGSGNNVQISAGEAVQEVEIFNVTDNVWWVWRRGLPATNTIKTVAAGTQTLDTTSAIVVTTVEGKSVIVLAAAAVPSAKLILYKIVG